MLLFFALLILFFFALCLYSSRPLSLSLSFSHPLVLVSINSGWINGEVSTLLFVLELGNSYFYMCIVCVCFFSAENANHWLFDKVQRISCLLCTPGKMCFIMPRRNVSQLTGFLSYFIVLYVLYAISDFIYYQTAIR